ncbi:MAG TPA: hypothetical protein VKR58_07460 [Aquella sp.]|nr:hypothetical protein [Aquella sp.]
MLQKNMNNLLVNPISYLETFFGAIEVDIEIPKDKYNYFGEYPPLFQTKEYSEELCGEFTKEVINKTRKGKKFQTVKRLIASLKATKIVLNSDLIKWLVEHGAKITKVYGIIPAERGYPFIGFMNWVTDKRRLGEVELRYAILASAAKNVGNSAYGRTIMNKNKFTNRKFCNEKQFNRAVNNHFFRDAEEYDGFYEVSSKPRVVKQNTPLQIGYNILQLAKLRMLQFAYDCIDKYIDRKDYQFMYMDTDSLYFALSDDFDKLIKPKLREEFEKDKINWFPRTDTTENKAFDKFKPGIFKIEFVGDGMVALCSKTYYCLGSKDKFSCKGTQKSRNMHILNFETYKNVLFNSETVTAVNSGFRYNNKEMKTYIQPKKGLSCVYPKAVTMKDGVHIRPIENI